MKQGIELGLIAKERDSEIEKLYKKYNNMRRETEINQNIEKSRM